MATRVNTKFVVILAMVVVLLVGGIVVAVQKLTKDAEDYARSAEESMKEADVLLANGEVEEANQKYTRAGKNFYQAKSEDARNTAYLYRFIDAHQKIVCNDLTLANNEINAILFGAQSIHNTPGASAEDRRYLYELLHDYDRMGVPMDGRAALVHVLKAAEAWLLNHPGDPVASHYLAMYESYRAADSTKNDERRREILGNITAAITAKPDNPWLYNSAGRFHIGNARRLYKASGSKFTNEVNATFYRAYEELMRAKGRVKDDPAPLVETMELMLSVNSQDEAVAPEVIGQKVETARKLYQMLQDKANRDKLFTEELTKAARYIGLMGTGIDQHPFDGLVYSLELAEAVLEDRPNDPAAYALVGTIYRERAKLAEAEQAIESGLNTLDGDRMVNGTQYVRDAQARLEMLSTLAEVKITLAQQSGDDPDRRKALLVEAAGLVKQLSEAPTPSLDWRQMRTQYLSGQIDFSYGRMEQAVAHLEKANSLYNRDDQQKLQILQYLGETHRRLGNDARVVKCYEEFVQIQPLSPLRLSLVNAYLTSQDTNNLDKAAVHLTRYLSQYPDNLTALQLKANLLEQRKRPEQALALLEGIELTDEQTQEREMINKQIARIKVAMGQVGDAARILEEQLANRPEGSKMNLSVVSQLISLMPTLQDKLDKLGQLEKQGLDPEIAGILRNFIRNGKLTLEDEMKLLDAQDHSPGARAIRRFAIYRRFGMNEEAKAELKKSVELEPKLPEVLEWRFRMALSDGDWEDAGKAIDGMLELDLNARPDMAIADGAFLRAQIIAQQAMTMQRSPERDTKLRDAARAYNKALDKYSQYVEGWIQLGQVQLVQDNFFAAQESFREALGLQSRNVKAIENMAKAEIATGDEPRALERFETILRIQPNHPTALDQFTALAQKLGVAGRAIIQRQRIADRVPGNTGNRRALALLYAQDQSYDDAKEQIDALIKLEGRTQANLAVLSRVLVLGDKADRAVQEVTAYLDEQGDKADWRDYLLLAETYEIAGKTEQATQAYAKAIEMEDPKTVPATLAWAMTLQKRGDTAEAAAVYKRLSKERPDNDNLKLQTVRVYLAAGEFVQAEEVAMTLPESPERYQLLIEAALGQEGKFAFAIQTARQGVKAFENNLSLHLQLARLLLTAQSRRPEDNRDFDETLKLAQDLLNDYPDRVEAQLLVADVNLAMGRNNQAVGQLERILEFAPTHIPANERLYSIRLAEAKQLSQTSVQASEAKATEALSIVALLIKSRPELPVLHRRAGEAAALANMDKQAADHFRNAFGMTKDPQDLASYANALLAIDQGPDARAVLEDPENATLVSSNLYLRALRGRALAASGEPDMAAALFQNTLRSAEDLQVRVMLANQASMAFSKNPDRAVEIIESVLGKDLPVQIDSVLAALMIQQREYAKAADRLSKYETDPVQNTLTQFNLLMQLALARQESEQLPESKATYEKALAIVDRDEQAIPMRQRVHLLNNMAYLLADQMPGYEQESVKYARRALALLPDNEAEENVALIEDTLGWSLYKAGQYEEAIKVLARSVAKYELAANQLHLGRAYLDKGDKDRALKVLRKAVNKAKADGDPKMIKETEKWLEKAL